MMSQDVQTSGDGDHWGLRDELPARRCAGQRGAQGQGWLPAAEGGTGI